VAVVAIILLIISLRALATFYTDYLWFQAVHYSEVWDTLLQVKLGLAAVFTLIMFVLTLASISVADRIGLKAGPLGLEDELAKRYQELFRPKGKWIRLGVALIFGLLLGTGAIGEWNNYLLFESGGSFNYVDPEFHRNAGYFVFKLPFLQFLTSWAILALIIVLLLTAVVYYLNGGIRVEAHRPKVDPRVKAHISIILAALALVKGAGYYLQRFALDLSTNGYVDGAGYTDVHARLPAITMLELISVVSAILFLVNVRRRGWVLPATGLSLWLLVSVLIGGIYPAIIQNFDVNPSQEALEAPYIQRNIKATDFAYNIANVPANSFQDNQSLTPAEVAANRSSLDDTRLWDTSSSVSLPTFQKLQDIRSYYNISQMSFDRYDIDGKETPVVVGVRAINSGDLPNNTWLSQHLQFTHGYGVVMALADTATADGNPQMEIRDVPATEAPGLPVIKHESIYYAPGLSGYVIVDTKQAEVDYQTASGQTVGGHYSGPGGVQLSSIWRQLAFALRLGDINPLISNQITSHSRIMFIRDVAARVERVAPFLQLDSNPFTVVSSSGNVYYELDAYTVSDSFPYSQQADTGALNPNSALSQINFNYIRDSVKIFVNAYTGVMKFYVIDPTDPIIRAYERVFPSMFLPMSDLSPSLQSHLRYPRDIMTVQSAMFARYHIAQASNFYSGGDAWALAQSAGSGPYGQSANVGNSLAPTSGSGGSTGGSPMAPIYQITQLPDQSSPSLSLIEAFAPYSSSGVQQNLTAFLAASSAPGTYGELRAYITPRGQQLDGPALVNARIDQQTSISKALSLLNQNGSSVVMGSLLMEPVDQSLLYVRPVYVSSSANPLPELKDVIVVYGTQVAMEPTLGAALSDVLQAPAGVGNSAGVVESTPPSPAPSPSSGKSGATNAAIAPIVSQLQSEYATAQSALSAGNLGAYQQAVTAIGALVQKLSAAEATGSTSPSSTTTTSVARSTSSTSTTTVTAHPAVVSGSTPSAGGAATMTSGPA
jgi:uncharacterized membrane protein (UPF0182 family)